MTQLVLSLHEVIVEPLHTATGSADAKPLHVAVDLAIAGAVLTETSCLCVRV
jgi:hypothetical protein